MQELGSSVLRASLLFLPGVETCSPVPTCSPAPSPSFFLSFKWGSSRGPRGAATALGDWQVAVLWLLLPGASLSGDMVARG